MELACGKSCLFQILPFFAIPTTLKARKSYLPSRLRDCLLPIFPLSQTPPLTIPQSQWQKALFYIETTLIWYIKQYRKYCTALCQLPLHKGAKSDSSIFQKALTLHEFYIISKGAISRLFNRSNFFCTFLTSPSTRAILLLALAKTN